MNDMFTVASLEDAFRAMLGDDARPRFEGTETLAQLRDAALAAYPDLAVDANWDATTPMSP